MCQTPQLRFANEYSCAVRELRLQIDQALAFLNKQSDALGVVFLVGVDATDVHLTAKIVLHPDSFSIDEFNAVLKTFETIGLCVLVVRAENVYPPVVALKLLAEKSAKCELIRVSAANLSYQFCSLERLIEFAAAQSTRCGSCSRSANCAAAALVGDLKTHIVVNVNPSDGTHSSV
ncbi:MAG: hypothetical protein P4L53_23600 [Candidatus Obscuribacterales bacterium]|nr:hypothetical protein [Candidatus Obscuribacterales bacterium]